MAAVRRKAVLDDARQRRGALAFTARFFFDRQGLVRARERARVDQPAMVLGLHVVGPEIVAILVVVAPLQVRDELAVGRNLDSAQGRAGKVGRGEQAFQWEFPRPGRCGEQQRARQGEARDGTKRRRGAPARHA